jgi:hypothetical protein
MNDLRDYLDSAGELPDDILLGRIVMFTVAETFVDRARLESEFSMNRLNPSLLPPPIKKVNAFKKATTDLNDTTYANPTNSRVHNVLLTRRVATDTEMVTRFIVREVRDEARKALYHQKVIECVFYKSNGSSSGAPERAQFTRIDDDLEPWEIPHIDAAIAQMEADYDKYANFHDSNAIRAMIRDYLKYLNSIELRGGVYFVHKSRTDELLRLRTAVRALATGCRLDLIPLIDLENEREIIIDAFQREAEQALMEVVRDSTFVLNTRKTVTPDAYAKLKGRYDAVLAQASEYQRTLRLTQDRTSNAAELALDSLAAVQKALLEGGS